MSGQSTLATIADRTLRKVLNKYELRRTGEHATPDWQVVLYSNATTAVRVYLEKREPACLVQLFRLRGDSLPISWGVDERAQDPDNGFDVLDLRALKGEPIEGIANKPIEQQLERFAQLLEEDAAPILSGDFALFPKLAPLVADRRRHNARHSTDLMR